jgi:hypothetical protein
VHTNFKFKTVVEVFCYNKSRVIRLQEYRFSLEMNKELIASLMLLIVI